LKLQDASFTGNSSRFVTLLSSPSNSSQTEDSVLTSEVDETPSFAKNASQSNTQAVKIRRRTAASKKEKVVPLKDGIDKQTRQQE